MNLWKVLVLRLISVTATNISGNNPQMQSE